MAWEQYAAHNKHVQDSEISTYTEKWLFKNYFTIPKKKLTTVNMKEKMNFYDEFLLQVLEVTDLKFVFFGIKFIDFLNCMFLSEITAPKSW